MNRKQLIKKYIEFFKSKDHKEIQNASLIPENDPTVLFTTAGMHPLVPFLLGEKHPQGKRLVNIQRCIRTVDIGEVGDIKHHTFFEQMGNWSIGDYGKTDAIKYTFEFLTASLKIPLNKLAASIFEGNSTSPKDKESYSILLELGLPEERIAILDKNENWWGPAGKTGPCGPDSEIFYWISEKPVPKTFDYKNENWMELGNNVFMEYNKDSKGNLLPLKQKNVDYGGGFERMLAILEGHNDNYMTEAFKQIIQKIEQLSNKKYEDYKKEMRIIADHIKAATFIIADGIIPGNSEQGYVVRRLIRRAIKFKKELEIKESISKIAKPIFKIYNDYKHLEKNKKQILKELKQEEDKFEKTLEKGLKIFEKITKNKKEISCKDAFLLYQSYGFPIEMTIELAKEQKIKVDETGFKKECKSHEELSRTASAGKFKSGLADNSEQTKKLHTACHMLNEALRVILKNPDIHQKGSNITPERLRFDFNFDRKLTDEEKQKIEDLVNKKIQEKIPIEMEEMPLDKAQKSGAQGIFDDKYKEKVKVYSTGNF